jgi:Fuc2NAc and GlcNAc transferase
MTRWYWLGPLLTAVGVEAWLMTGVVRRHALVKGVLDMPGARSSHTVPIPRGGGLAVVAAFGTGIAFLMVMGDLPFSTGGALLGAGLAVAAVGFADDVHELPVHWRLCVHLAAAVWAWALVGRDVEWAALTGGLLPSWLGPVVVVLGLVWLLNLFNFMDGIDGIAAVQTVCACVGGALLAACAGVADGWVVPLVLAAAVGGFLVWNWPPARIFLGDVGSGFLGLTVGLMALDAARSQPKLLWGWAVLLAVFVSDASMTLLRRALRGERVYVAHRNHAYQRLARRWGDHRPVTVLVGVIDLLWLLPLALATVRWPAAAAALTVLAYAPLVAGVWCLGAGRSEDARAIR